MTRRMSLLVLAVGLVGCAGDKRTPTYAVTGSVLVNGKPAEHANVTFHPVAGGDAPKARGKVAADGTFKLTTYDGDDGAPAGKYKVTVEWYLATGRGDEPPRNTLPAKYAAPDSSGLEADVTAGPTTLKPFELKR